VWDFFWGDAGRLLLLPAAPGQVRRQRRETLLLRVRLAKSDRKDRAMYSVVNKRTGQVLASNLTLDAVDTWIARNESKYAGIRVVGMTIFVADNID
jgi:hypothetical protein